MAEAPDPQTIGKYKVLGFLGQGAMGKVYKAHDPILNRFVAVKTISSLLATDPELRKRFYREAQAAARLNHPNVVTVYEYGEDGPIIYIAMELLEGTDLKGFVESGALKSLGAKLRIIEQICDGLAFAHAKGVVHRDMKPANVHVSMSGQVKIMDFGLARVDSGDRSKAGMVVGTPNYMSPEQVMGDEVDARTDIFSTGAVCYELLTSRKPFDADSVHGILFQVVHKEPTPVRQVVQELPPIVAEVVEKALAKDRTVRFQSAAEFREALKYVEHALASGRPNEARLSRAGDPTMMSQRPLAVPPPAGTPVAPSPDSVDGTVALDIKVPLRRPSPRSGSSPAARERTRPPARVAAPPPRRSAGPLIAAGVAVVALAAAGFFYFERQSAAPVAPPPSLENAQVSALTSALVQTKVELGREKLENKEYREAIAVAEDALRRVPGNREARRLRDDAKARLDELEAAATEARAAVQAGENERAAAALSQLLALDPKHPAAVEISAQLNSSFRKQAEDARRLAEDARKQAEKAHAGGGDFESAAALAREADAQFRRGGFADSARGFLESRDVFDRARRSASTPTPSAATAVAAATPGRIEVLPTAAVPVPALPVEPEVAAAAEPRRAFVIGDTVVQSRKASRGLAGFENTDVSVQEAAELQCRIDLEVSPPAVRAGDAYKITAALTNVGRKPVRIKDARLEYHVNGQARPQGIAFAKELAASQTVPLAEAGGAWDEGVQAWSLAVVVVSDKGETCKREVRLARR